MKGSKGQRVKGSRIDFKIYLITDRKLIPNPKALIPAVREALEGGVRAIQLREKDLEIRELLELAYKMREVTGRYKAKLFINDRVDVALAVGADGVHLGRNSIPPIAVRKIAKKLIIGASTHGIKEAVEAEKSGADFITLGPVYKTPSKLKYGKPIGIDTLKKVRSKVSIPVFAIGGIKEEKVKEVMDAGAEGIALISGIFAAKNIKGKAEYLLKLLG